MIYKKQIYKNFLLNLLFLMLDIIKVGGISFNFLYIFFDFEYDKIVKIKLLKNKYFSQEGALFRYSLSYCLLLALLPTMLMFFMFYYDLSYVVAFLNQLIPQEFINGYIKYLVHHQNENMISLIFSFFLAGFVASKVFYSFMILAMKDENYQLSLIVVRIKSFFTFLLFVICLVCIFVLFHFFQLSSLTFLLLFIVFYLFYRLLSFEKKSLSYGVLGASVVSLSIMLMGYLFLWYIDTFTAYEKLYGSFDILFVLYFSMYILSSIIYFGYCLNIIFQKKKRDIVYKHERIYKKLAKIGNHFRL